MSGACIIQKVHPYIATGLSDSKFGVDDSEALLMTLLQMEQVQLIGLHCHLGSAIEDVGVMRYLLHNLGIMGSNRNSFKIASEFTQPFCEGFAM